MAAAMNPRLAFFFPHLGVGGVQRSLLLLAEGFLAQFVAVDLVVGDASGSFRSRVPAGARVVDLKARRIHSALPALTRYLKRTPPTALLAAQTHVNILACWARALSRSRVPLVISEHNNMTAVTGAQNAGRDRWRPLFARLFYPWADAIVAVSVGAADSLSAMTGLRRDSIQVIHNPLIPSNLQTLTLAPAGHPWLADRTKPVILAAGRLTPQKDYPTLLHAMAHLRKQHDLRLLILGEGAQRSALESLIRKMSLQESVELPGYVENVYAWMARASLFALSSAWEGFPSVLVEAMACNVPVVATDCPSGPAEILEGGLHGRLVPTGRPDLLAQAIEATLAEGSPVKSAAMRAMQFSMERAVSAYAPLLLGALP